MKYALFLLYALPLFATEPTMTEQKWQDDLAQGKTIPVVEKGEVKAWTMDPVTNELENQKLSTVVEDASDE